MRGSNPQPPNAQTSGQNVPEVQGSSTEERVDTRMTGWKGPHDPQAGSATETRKQEPV